MSYEGVLASHIYYMSDLFDLIEMQCYKCLMCEFNQLLFDKVIGGLRTTL